MSLVARREKHRELERLQKDATSDTDADVLNGFLNHSEKLRDHIQSTTLVQGSEPQPDVPDHNGISVGIAGLLNCGRILSPFGPDVTNVEHSELPLHHAVRSRNQSLLQILLDKMEWKWNIEAQDERDKGERPIHVAAEIDNLPALRLLLEYGADPHSRQQDFHRMEAVHIAAAKGSVLVLKYLVENVTSVRESHYVTTLDSEGATALFWAVIGNNNECVKILLEHGSIVDHRQTTGSQATPVHYACIQNSLEIVQILADQQPVRFRKALSMSDAEGCTPLNRAIILDRPGLVEYLLEKGSPMDKVDNERRSPIILAVTREAWRSATVLLKWGANPFLCDSVMRRTTFHHAAIIGADPTSSPEITELVENHAEAVQSLDSLDAFGYSAVQYAAGYGHLAAFRGLVGAGANLTSQNVKNRTALHYAAKYGQLEMVKAILEHESGPSILNSIDRRGRSPLHAASSHGHLEVVELLLSKGAFAFRYGKSLLSWSVGLRAQTKMKSSSSDDHGRTALHLAAEKNHYYILGSVITYFAVVLNNADKDGKTALHLASANNATKAVQYLLTIGALITEDSYGRTPLDLAIYNKNAKVALTFVNSENWKQIVRLPSQLYGTVILGFITHLPEVMKRILDRCISKSIHHISTDCYVEYDLSILQRLDVFDDWQQKSAVNKPKFVKKNIPMHALRAMATSGRSELLAHPVCTTLLERKWLKFGMWCSGFVMICNVTFVTLLSYVVVSAVTTELRPHLLRTSYCNVHRHAPDQLKSSAFDLMRQTSDPLLSNHTSAQDFCEDGFYRRDARLTFQDTPSLLVLNIALFLIFLKELAQLRSEGWKYFAEWMNYMELMLFVSCGGFVVCFYQDDMSGKVGPLTYQFAAVALFLAWFNLLRFCRPFGTFGIYSFMFFCILKTLVKVFFFFLLICAFTGAFFTLFHMFKFPDRTDFYAHSPNLDVMSLRTPHYQIHTSGLRICTMTIGDLEAIENLINPLLDGMLEYPVVSFIFYAMFMMLMPILLNNLVTALAIGDMAQVISNATSLRLEMQVYLHESLEKLFPTCTARRFQQETQLHRVYPAKSLSLLECIAQWLQSGGIRNSVGIADRLHGDDQTTDDNEDLAMEFSRMQRRVKHIDTSLSDQQALLQQMLAELGNLTRDDDKNPATAYASSIANKARKRSERSEEDRRQAAKLHIPRRNAAAQFGLRGSPSPSESPLRKAFSFMP